MREYEENHCLNLSWVFGLAANVPGNLIDISHDDQEEVAYVSGHTVILYNRKEHRQRFLRGHRNAITAFGSSLGRDLLISADSGDQSLVLFWHVATGQVVHSLEGAHLHGVMAMDVSDDGRWLVTVGTPDPQTQLQEVALWTFSWTSPSSLAVAPRLRASIPAGDPQFYIKFNNNDPSEFITNGKRRVYFWRSVLTQGNVWKFKYYSPPLRAKDFRQTVGDYVQSVFLPDTTQAVTGTTDGDVIIWDEQGASAELGTHPTDRRPKKIMRVHQQMVRVLTVHRGFLVTGGNDGFVRFFDPMMRIVAWFEDLKAGPVTALSFKASQYAEGGGMVSLQSFDANDFLVATSEGKVLNVRSSSFDQPSPVARQGELLIDPMPSEMVDVACHPLEPLVAVLGGGGVLEIWNLTLKQRLSRRDFNSKEGSCVVYAKDGSFLVLGFTDGSMHLVDSSTLDDLFSGRNSSKPILRASVSSAGHHVALADARHQVLLYGFVPFKQAYLRWEYLGRYQSHHGPIVGLQFGETPSGTTCLFSHGQDHRLLQYDLDSTSAKVGVQLVGMQDVPRIGAANSTSMCFAPPMPYFTNISKQTLLLISDDHHKVKIYDPEAQRVEAVYLGPTYGGSFKKLIAFRCAGSEGSWLAYQCQDRLVGLMGWPLDGHPQHMMGVVAHPGEIRGCGVSCDGQQLITAGAEGAIHIWDVDPQPLAPSPDNCPAPPGSRWDEVLEDQQLADDIVDFFYYAQICAQGKATAAPRHIPGCIPVDAVPDLMRAVGYYPSKAEEAALLAHVQFLAHSSGQGRVEAVDLDTFLALFHNHRHHRDISLEDVQAAFNEISPGNAGTITKQSLLQLLTTKGEPLTEEELLAAVHTLVGEDTGLPDYIDARTFACDLLGFETVPAADGTG